MPYGNNNAIIAPLPTQGWDCSSCSPLSLNPKGILRGEQFGESVFVAVLRNDPAAADLHGETVPKALFTTRPGCLM